MNNTVNVLLIYSSKKDSERLALFLWTITKKCIVRLFGCCSLGQWINEITPVQLWLCISLSLHSLEVSWVQCLRQIPNLLFIPHPSLIKAPQIPYSTACSPKFTRVRKCHNDWIAQILFQSVCKLFTDQTSNYGHMILSIYLIYFTTFILINR